MNSQEFITVFVLALVTGTTALTITRTRVFQRPRIWLRKRGEWWDKLITCPYCTGHYIALLLNGLYQPRLLEPKVDGVAGDVVVFLTSWFATVALASMVVGLMVAALSQLGEPEPIEVKPKIPSPPKPLPSPPATGTGIMPPKKEST